MNIQDLVNKFCTSDVSVKNLARSYAELATSKSKSFLKNMDSILKSTLADQTTDVVNILTENANLNSIIMTTSGEAYKLLDLCHAMQDESNNLSETMLNAKSGVQQSVDEIMDDLTDQYVSISAMTATFDSLAQAKIDEGIEKVEISYADFKSRIENAVGELNGTRKAMIDEYYSILTQEGLSLRDKVSAILDGFMGDSDYHTNDDSPIEFYTKPGDFSGVTPWAAWCIENNISWSSAWSVIKSAAKMVGITILGAFKAVGLVIKSFWNKVTEPFTAPDAIEENSRFTTDFFDLPIAQGHISPDLLEDFLTSDIPGDDTIGSICGTKNINFIDWLRSNSDQGITCFETSFLRVSFWIDNVVDNVDYSNIGGLVGYMINIAPTSYDSDSFTGNFKSHLPAIMYGENISDYAIVTPWSEYINYYSTYDSMANLKFESQQENFRGVLSSLCSIEAMLAAMNESPISQMEELIEYPKHYETTSQDLINKWINNIKANGGLIIHALANGSQVATTYGKVISTINFSTNGDFVKDPTNADFFRVISNSNSDPFLSVSEVTSNASRGIFILCSIIKAILRAKDTTNFIPYRHIRGLGTPRYSLKADSSKGVITWLIVTTIVTVAAVVIGLKFASKRHKQRRLAKLQGDQWKYSDMIASSEKGSNDYNFAVSKLARTNRKIARVEARLGVIDSVAGNGITAISDEINKAINNTNADYTDGKISRVISLIHME